MDLGFETVGNATLIIHDRGPLLATDPWTDGSAYFGSWALAHPIPAEQLESIRAAKFAWISHGHPDHLSPMSLDRMRCETVLLPEHHGGRIKEGLEERGAKVQLLRDGEWTQLSERVRVCCVSDYNQDAALFVDLGGVLIVNANDASDRGVGDFLRATAARYDQSFLLCLTGFGDADMIHFFDTEGRLIVPAAAERAPLGPGIANLVQYYGLKKFVPFSSLHKYQRADSAWANAHIARVSDYPVGVQDNGVDILPAFVRFDALTGIVTPLRPPELDVPLLDPKAFDDDWTERLSADELDRARRYFGAIEHLSQTLDFVTLRVGGRDHTIDLRGRDFRKGIVFEAPRHSLMKSIEWEVFDDMLIGNYMKTTLIGDWPVRGNPALYPDFTPFVAKYADNGKAKTAEALRRYFEDYKRRGFAGPGPTAATQAAWHAFRPYLGAEGE